MSSQLEPPKGLLHFALSKGSTTITTYLFLRNNIQEMFSSQKTSAKHPIPVKGSFSVKKTQLMVSSKETSRATYFVGS
jgi:hypothetical protein